MKYFLSDYLSRIDKRLNVKVSLDGVGQIHDNIRGIKGAFQKTMKTIDIISDFSSNENRINGTVVFTAMPKNLGEIQKVYNLTKERNLDFFVKPVMNANMLANFDIKFDWKKEDIERLTSELRFIYNQEIKERQKDLFLRIEKHATLQILKNTIESLSENKKKFKCYATISSIWINSNGDVYPCHTMGKRLGNVTDMGLNEIFRSDEMEKVRKHIMDEKCYCLNACEGIPSVIMNDPLFFMA
jgi:MoaA/NifB/PqqE/SkfB family radical SAM enzyme